MLNDLEEISNIGKKNTHGVCLGLPNIVKKQNQWNYGACSDFE